MEKPTAFFGERKPTLGLAMDPPICKGAPFKDDEDEDEDEAVDVVEDVEELS